MKLLFLLLAFLLSLNPKPLEGPTCLVNASLTLTSQANSAQYLGNNVANAIYFNTTYDTQIRIQARVTTLSGSVNSPRFYPSYSIDDGSNWIDIGTGADLTNLTGDALTLASTGHKVSGWIALPSGAIGATILFRITQNGGNASASPVIASACIQTK